MLSYFSFFFTAIDADNFSNFVVYVPRARACEVAYCRAEITELEDFVNVGEFQSPSTFVGDQYNNWKTEMLFQLKHLLMFVKL